MLAASLLSLLGASAFSSSEKPVPSPVPEFDAFSDAVNTSSRGRDLSSVGCQNCCTANDCRLAYMMTSPGVCCGAHPMTGMSNCCPFDASCVRCQSKWRCTRSTYISRSTACSVCQGDLPSACYRRYPTHHSSGGSSFMFGFILLLIIFCAVGACMQRRGAFQEDVVVVQQGVPGGPVCGQQVVYAQPGYGGGYGGGGVATGAAAGFVGGMLVGEALDHGGGYGYGGGYGGDYGGGYGGDMGGGMGDGGFSAD